MEQQQIVQADRDHLIHGFDSLRRHTAEGGIILVEGKGIYLKDIHGRTYIDGYAGLLNVVVGHGQEEIKEAIQEQLDQVAYVPGLFEFASVPTVRLAEKLAEIAPSGLNRVILTSGGSEANETIIRLIRLYNQVQGKKDKVKIIALNMAYHGSTTGAATLTGIDHFHEMFDPLLPGVVHMVRPYCYRCELGKTYPSCEMACADELERVVLREGPETVAAFIAEPIQGGGGVIIPPPEYFPKIREICDKYNMLFIADEVITGFGRTGKMFGMEHWGVVPDVIAFAKGVTSGYLPLGGVIFHEQIYETLANSPGELSFWHGFTNGGHPLCCAAALRNLALIEELDLVRGAEEKGAYFLAVLKERVGNLRMVDEIRGKGLWLAVELVKDKESKTPFAPSLNLGKRVRRLALDRGFILRAIGDIIAFGPPLIITHKEIDTIVDIFADVLKEVERAVDHSE